MRKPSTATGLAAFSGCGATVFGGLAVSRVLVHADGITTSASTALAVACLTIFGMIATVEIVNRPEVIQAKGVRATSKEWLRHANSPAERERILQIQIIHAMIARGVQPKDETISALLQCPVLNPLLDARIQKAEPTEFRRPAP